MKKLVLVMIAAALVSAPIAYAQDGGSAGTTKEQYSGANAKDKPASQNNTKPDSDNK